MRAGAIIRARLGSSRLPGKTLATAAGRTMLAHCVERLRLAGRIGEVVVATTAEAEDDPVAAECARIDVACFRGSVDDVLGRVAAAAEEHAMEHVAHFGADNPLIDPGVVDEVLDRYFAEPGRWDYVTNNRPPTWPEGLEVEVTPIATLRRMAAEARTPREREHILTWLWDRADAVAILNVTTEPNRYHDERWTVDQPEDLELVRALLEALPAGFSTADALAWLDAHPAMRELNAHHGDDYPWR
jgi:spore coat polysaccharide biosynthesis protein SpsF